MAKLDLTDVNLIGEKLVEKWLIENDYSSISKENIQLNEFGFQAFRQFENILVKVKTVVHPHKTFKFSDYEIDQLCRRGLKSSLIAYAAYVVIDDNGVLVGEINWERLSLK